MGDKNVIRTRTCSKCESKIEGTAQDIKEHAQNCKGKA